MLVIIDARNNKKKNCAQVYTTRTHAQTHTQHALVQAQWEMMKRISGREPWGSDDSVVHALFYNNNTNCRRRRDFPAAIGPSQTDASAFAVHPPRVDGRVTSRRESRPHREPPCDAATFRMKICEDVFNAKLFIYGSLSPPPDKRKNKSIICFSPHTHRRERKKEMRMMMR